MKVSIIVPVYNGEETIKKCLNSILGIEYKKENYELIIINDCSLDKSKTIIKNFIKKNNKKLKIIFVDLDKNKGRIEARLRGVKSAIHNNLLFIDHRCLVDKKILNKIKNKNYEPIIGNPRQNLKNNLISRFFYIFRSILYKPYFGKKFLDVYINKSNFNKVAKGFSPFYCSKKRFLNSLPKDRGKWVNDDTLIFSKIIKDKEILKTSDVYCVYKERTSIKEFIWHIYTRGPKFFNYYFNNKSKYFWLIIFILLSPLFLIFIIYFFRIMYIYFIIFILVTGVIFLHIKGFKSKDMLSILLVGPLVYFIFSIGIYHGFLQSLFKRS